MIRWVSALQYMNSLSHYSVAGIYPQPTSSHCLRVFEFEDRMVKIKYIPPGRKAFNHKTIIIQELFIPFRINSNDVKYSHES